MLTAGCVVASLGAVARVSADEPVAAPAPAVGTVVPAAPAAGAPRAVESGLAVGAAPSVAPARLSALAPAEPDGLAGLPFVPFARKRGEWLDGVRLGLWPAERRAVRDPAYANPAGFYVVTEALRAHPVSRHFTLGEFAMRSAARGPAGESYLVLDPALVEKLERVLDELTAAGIAAGDLRILSAFRAPHHNAGIEGAAPSSRHQFGDAADVVVDGDGDGRMDDLNRDGRVDRADVQLVAEAVARVERRHPELAGGLGLYDAQGPSGPFLHIDVRGRATRWGPGARSAAPAPAWRPTPAWSDAPPARPSPGLGNACRAAGADALLCVGRRGG